MTDHDPEACCYLLEALTAAALSLAAGQWACALCDAAVALCWARQANIL